MKKQVIVIHGGETFEKHEEYLNFLKDLDVDLESLKKKKWKKSLEEKLGEDFEVISLQMPNGFNARYSEWKIWFEKYIPLFNEEIILLGHSLGGSFLAKYLSENKIDKKVIATLLVAAPFNDKDTDYSLVDFNLTEDMKLLEKQSEKVFLYHSKDDSIVSFHETTKFKRSLPSIELKVFEDRDHFSQEEFPELVNDIKSL
jgi:predicted alpha/beta hydrolase family esterase